jgi:beta-mannanase
MFLGVYDRIEGIFDNVKLDVEADYVSWENSQELNSVITRIRAHQRVPLVTIEPFTTASGDPQQVLQETVAGLNDVTIAENAGIIKAHAPQVVLVRFAHEMELVGNYPWSQKDADLYIKAYRYYVDFFRKEGVNNVEWVWAPAGNPNAAPYYPGSEYVDYIGVSILGFEDWDLKFGHKEGRSFQSVFSERLWLLEFRKPIIITELGVTPSASRNEAGKIKYQYEWLWNAWEAWYYYPNLRGIVYFNAINAENAWQGERPDWRIPTSALPPAEQMPPHWDTIE